MFDLDNTDVMDYFTGDFVHDLDFYENIFSGFFHALFEVLSFLFTIVLGSDLLFTIVLTVRRDRVGYNIVLVWVYQVWAQ